MPTLYIAVYLVPLDRRPPPQPDAITAAFYESARASDFPYDVGDDPSFFSSSYHHSPVTWGVCRPDVRCNIKVGDWVAFFSAEHSRESPSTTLYRFVCALLVERKLPHTSLSATGSPFAGYLNLLIRPRGAGWEHYEPGLRASQWHKDWLWRIICGRRHFKKEVVEAAGKSHSPGGPLMLGGQPLPVANNYVIFSDGQSVRVPDPPVVATHRRGEGAEVWLGDRRSRSIREIVLGDSGRNLRTANYIAHRHVRRELDDPSWWQTLAAAL